MRASAVRSIRLLPKTSLSPSDQRFHVIPSLSSIKTTSTKKSEPTVIDKLETRKAKSPESWPSNLRLEPVVKKEQLRHVDAKIRPKLKGLLKER